ncbi:sulfite exporter TauE/SafE family protein [Parapedobacter defluvii]|uniref:sulfite exporter TauE/SafE family protein n=1 Tax=Parapedobacter defluvii TaxID=2045106 RepID=UPI000FA0DD46|nr:MAG: sulfite exporter TauE/SafE family protein [Parapedobacter sp.]
MNYHTFAFFMGLFGSLHCVAMCGPLVWALPNTARSRMGAVVNRMVYQMGRIATYGMLGLVVGIIGNAVLLKGWQQGISLFTGGVLVALGLIHLFGNRFPRMMKAQQVLVAPLVRKMGYFLYRPGGNFLAGVLNGFLPCGMVYMALASALNADSLTNSVWFMLLFGLGTLPMMVGAVLLGHFMKHPLRVNMAKWLPILYILIGGWFLLRGANLNIPYVSPLIYPEGSMKCVSM